MFSNPTNYTAIDDVSYDLIVLRFERSHDFTLRKQDIDLFSIF